jgi:alkylhydroperoxidase family enzyme
MTRIEPIELTGLYGSVVKRFSKRMLGSVPETMGVYWNNPAVLKALLPFSGKAQKWDACDLSLKSFAHMAVASQVGCEWCLDFGYFEAFNKNLDIDKAREVPRWRESELFTPLEREVLEYAEAMSQTTPNVTDDMVASLRSQLGEAAVVELTAFIGLANFYTRTNNALGIEADGFAAACELKPLAQRSRAVGSVA